MKASRQPGKALIAFVAVAAAGCAQPSRNATVELELPARASFAPVSGTLQARCGTLDCHGNPARNMRVYGVYGMRAAADCAPGDPDTTELDVAATYQAVVGVDPEGLHALASGSDANAGSWLVLAKGSGLVDHKGGVLLESASAGQRCLLSWARGSTDDAACFADVLGPVPREGESW